MVVLLIIFDLILNFLKNFFSLPISHDTDTKQNTTMKYKECDGRCGVNKIKCCHLCDETVMTCEIEISFSWLFVVSFRIILLTLRSDICVRICVSVVCLCHVCVCVMYVRYVCECVCV